MTGRQAAARVAAIAGWAVLWYLVPVAGARWLRSGPVKRDDRTAAAPGNPGGMPTTAADLRYGRRGGRWLPAGYTPALDADTPRCDVCDRPLAAGQAVRHASCAVPADQLFPV